MPLEPIKLVLKAMKHYLEVKFGVIQVRYVSLKN
jgi:hypothetical protein